MDALKLGVTVLFQDVDLIWFKNPLEYFVKSRQNHDIQIMYDGPNGLYKPLFANSGFIYVNPSEVNLALFETALRNSASILATGSHQFPLNRILNCFVEHNLLKLNILPQNLFLNGHLFSLSSGLSSDAKNWKEDGIVFHYSWTGTKEEKFQKLEKFGMNYIWAEVSPFLQKRNNVNDEIKLTIQLSMQDPIELMTNLNANILQILYREYYFSQRNKNRNAVIKLIVFETGDEEQKEIIVESSKIIRIDADPPLSSETLSELNMTKCQMYRLYFSEVIKMVPKKILRILQRQI